MSAKQAFVRKFKVAGFTCEVSLPRVEPSSVSSVVVAWSPRVPVFDLDLTPSERSEYERRLMQAIAEASP